MPPPATKEVNKAQLNFDDWHRKLGQPNSKLVFKIIKENNLVLSTSSLSPKCKACTMKKMSKLSLPSVVHNSQAPLKLVFSDVWGSSPILSNLVFHYFVFFVDDFVRYIWIYFIKIRVMFMVVSLSLNF